MKLSRPSHGTVVAYAALVMAMSGTAVAATGSTFITGKVNSATTTTSLVNPNGTALALRSKTGTPPITVSSTNTTKVPYLNSDLVDGLHANQIAPVVKAATNGDATSTTSTTLVDVPGTTITLVTPAGAARKLLLQYTAECAVTSDTTEGWANVQFLVDGVPYAAGGADSDNAFCTAPTGNTTTQEWTNAATQVLIPALAAGTHTIKMQYRASYGTNTSIRLDDMTLSAIAFA